MDIRNKQDLKLAYSLLGFLEDNLNNKIAIRDNKCIKDLKKSIRDYSKINNEYPKLVKSYGIDGYIELMRLPELIDTVDELNEYFRENEFLTCKPSIYDCTGQKFTIAYKCFKRRGMNLCFHEVAVDV